MVNYRLISCLCSFACFLLLLVAHCSHSWRTYYPAVGIYTMGLWTICSEINGCNKLDTGDVSLEFTRAFMLLGLVASFMAAIWAIEWDHVCHCNFTFVPKALMASICNFVAGTSVLVALVIFEVESARIPGKDTAFKNWAFYLSCCTGSLCIVIAHFDFVAYKCALWGTGGSHCNVVPEQKHAAESPTVAPALL